ncbi:hypothetical protein [Sphingomonas palmae]|uniref:hypothetical protein n=1 Tax=Sphingomonas palmae TaxID=1855283 RepID=UPI00115F8779|nr:hypothetical protein [Sphingomonas palmae]
MRDEPPNKTRFFTTGQARSTLPLVRQIHYRARTSSSSTPSGGIRHRTQEATGGVKNAHCPPALMRDNISQSLIALDEKRGHVIPAIDALVFPWFGANAACF